MSQQRILPHLAVSAAVHAAIAAAMVTYVGHQEVRVVHQEAQVREELARSERGEAELAQEEVRTATRDLMREQVRQDILAQLSAQVQAEQPLAKLAEAAEKAVDAELAKAEAMGPLDAMDDSAREQLADQLHEAGMAAAGEAIEPTLRDELIARIRSYTEQEAVPEVRRRIERALADQVGEQVRKAAEEALKSSKLDDAQRRAALSAALTKIAPKAAAAVTAAVTAEAVPRTTNVLVAALAEPIAKAGFKASEVEGTVRETIMDALREGLTAKAPDDEAALTRLAESAQANDPAAISAAADKADAAADALKSVAAAEETISKKAEQAAAQDGAARESASAELAEAAAEAHAASTAAVENAKSAVDSAVAATSQAADRRNQAAAAAADRRITDSAAAAQANLEHQAPQDAVANAANAAKSAREAAAALSQLGAAMRSAAAEAAKQQDAAKASKTEAPASASNAASAAADKALAESVPKAVADSAAKVDGGGLARAVNALTTGGSIAQLTNLKDRLGGKDADAAARSTTTVSRLTGGAAAAMASRGQGRGRGNGPATIDGSAVKKDAQSLRNTRAAQDEAAVARYNRAVYEAFTKDLIGRSDPGNFYNGGASQSSLVPTTAGAAVKPPAAAIYLDPQWKEERERTTEERYRFKADAKRALPEPAFKTIAFTGAPLQDRPLTIDGDLADWGPMRLPMTMRYAPPSNSPLASGPTAWMRWSPAGLYFAYRVDMDPKEIVGNTEKPYDGDCMELFIDTENTRKENMRDATSSHQMCFTPFGFQGDRSKTLCEAGRGLRGIPFHSYQWRQDGSSAVKVDDTGYTVECFLPRMALAKRTLLPGQYLAVNLSINRGLKSDPAKQWDEQRAWSASKFIGSWDKPSTWGDILLLGSDADVAIAPVQAGDTDGAVVPGQPIQVEVHDADMDLSPHVADRVLATIQVRDGAPMAVILGETGPATGVFRATLDTRSYILPPVANALGVRPGDVIEFTYVDARTAGGEKDQQVGAILGVSYPFAKIAAK